jgi:outer membrane immunogenic protein
MRKAAIGIVAVAAMIGTPVLAADMPLKAPPPPPAPVFSWTGFYVGGNLGYSWGSADNNWNFFATNPGAGALAATCRPAGAALCAVASDSARLNGALGGAQIGYNWQIGTYLAGIEADFDGSGQRGSDTFGAAFPFLPTLGGTITTSYSEALDWFGTVRARAGYVLADRWLIYATGGLAYGHVTTNGTASSPGFTIPSSALACSGGICPVANWSTGTTKAGWAAGAGIEGAIVGNWSWRVEYLHIDLGNVNMSFATLPGCFGGTAACGPAAAGTGSVSSHVTDDIVRVGVDYRFAIP